MALSSDQFKRLLLDAIAQEVRIRFAGATRSRTLREAWRTKFDHTTTLGRNSRVVVYVPHYWAWPYFEGHRRRFPIRAKFLAWFRDPSQDPRLNPIPVRRSQVKRLRLTRERFKELLASGELILRKSASAKPPERGFKAEVAQVPLVARPIVRDLTSLFIHQLIPKQAGDALKPTKIRL